MIDLYKVVVSFKHSKHGWINSGRFIKGDPNNHIIKRYVNNREIIRVNSNITDDILEKALLIEKE